MKNVMCCDVICKTHRDKQTTKTALVISYFTENHLLALSPMNQMNQVNSHSSYNVYIGLHLLKRK